MLNGTSSRDGVDEQENTPPGDVSERLPDRITEGGRTRAVSRHAIRDTHLGITAEIIEFVLDNWVIRGAKTETDGRQSMCHWAFAPDLGDLVRVVVSMDDMLIITAFRDRAATQALRKGNRGYFDRKYRDLEDRDAS